MPTIYKENGFNFYEINSKECSLGSKVTSTSGTAVDSTFSKECIIIPSRAGKYRVTEIGYKAFFEKTTIKRIKIKEGIKVINNNAFYGLPNLLLVIIPSSVEILGQWVISGYNNGQTATGTTTIIIGPNSKLKEIRAQGIERKDTYLIYFCGKKSPVTNGDPFFFN